MAQRYSFEMEERHGDSYFSVPSEERIHTTTRGHGRIHSREQSDTRGPFDSETSVLQKQPEVAEGQLSSQSFNQREFKEHGKFQGWMSHSWSSLLHFLTRWWLLEVAGWVICTVVIIVVIVLLRVYDETPLSRWTLGITLNSTISYLATLAQTSMLLPISECISQLKWIWYSKKKKPLADFEVFDRASRGPLGCLLFLPQNPRAYLALVAALVSILSLTIGPFIQQLIAFPIRRVEDPSTVPTSLRTDDYNVVTDVHSVRKIGVLDPRMKSAIYQGLFLNENQTVPAITPSCASGNCTWSPFNTLALCAGVEDVTDQVKASCPKKQNIYTDDPCNYTLPNNVTLETGKNLVVNSLKNQSLAFTGLNEPIIDFFMVYIGLNSSFGFNGTKTGEN